MLGKRISIGNNRRKTPISKKTVILILVLILLIFLSIWQVPLNRKTISGLVPVPKATELK